MRLQWNFSLTTSSGHLLRSPLSSWEERIAFAMFRVLRLVKPLRDARSLLPSVTRQSDNGQIHGFASPLCSGFALLGKSTKFERTGTTVQ